MSIQSQILMQSFVDSFAEQVPDASVRQILLHALDVFSRKGFAGAKIKDIALQGGFSQGYVYNYFKSKDEIFTRLVELATGGAGTAVRQAVELEGSPLERITWLTEALLDPQGLAMKHWQLILLQTASEAIPEAAIQIAQAQRQAPFTSFIPLLIEGQQAGEIVKEDPLMLALTYFSIIQGVGLSRAQTTTSLPFPSAEVVLRFMTQPTIAQQRGEQA